MIRAQFLALAAFIAFVAMTAPPADAASKVMTMVDTDHDGTIDMKEAQAAASALFARLDRDHDGTLDIKELRGHLTLREFRAAGPAKDGTLTEDEFLVLVAKQFQAADSVSKRRN